MSFRRLCFALLSTLALQAQVETARLTGTVRDTSGAVVARASITFVNVETGITSRAATDDTGRYESFPLHIGKYRVIAEQSGFKRAVREGIVLQIQQTAVVDLILEVGAISQEVSIVAAAPLLTVNEATNAQVIDNQKIVELPLNGRNYVQLALLSAGTGDPGYNTRAEGGFSGGGMRATMNNFILDGMDNNNRQLALSGRMTEPVRPSVDAIEEFKVMTNSYSAEHGRAGGAVVNVGIKSGTNALRGSAYEFLRNEALDAKNFFDSPDQPKPPYKRNQFGWSLGGPIRKNRTFFFGDYEWNRIRESRTVNGTVPTPSMRKGDFSEILPSRIYDPATYDPSTNRRQAFPGNVIPASRFDPVGAKALAWYPAPNRPGLINNFLYNPPLLRDTNQWDAKIDHNFGSRDNFFGRFSFLRDLRPAAPDLPPPAFGGTKWSPSYRHDGRSLATGYNHIFTPNLVLSTKAGWNRMFTNRYMDMKENLNQAIGLRGVGSTLPGSALLRIQTGQTWLGPAAYSPNLSDSQTRQLLADATWIHGRHTLKFGANLGWMQMYETNAAFANGQFTFDGSFTWNSSTGREGSGIADLLLGAPASAQVSNVAYMNQRAPWYDSYVQEEWKATRRLTLNLGLRYELRLPFVETRDGWANFDIDSVPGQVQLVYPRTGSRYDRATIRTDANNFGPRFGFAYQAAANTVVRGGYGIYYVGFQPFGDSQYLHANPPFQLTANVTTDKIHPTILLRDGLPPDTLDLRRARDVVTSSYDRGGALPYSQQWSFSIQRQLPSQTLLEIGYYANTTHKLLQRIEGNWALPGPGKVNDRRRFRSVFVPAADTLVTLSNCSRHQWSANANFHSMQLRAEKRLTRGLSLLASYVWSKTITDARGAAPDGGVSEETPQNPRDLRAERSVADEHVPHRFVASYVYDLPFGQRRRFLPGLNPVVNAFLGGWSVAGITTVSAGERANLRVTQDVSGTGDPNRPNVLHDWRLPPGQRSLSRWFDTTAFELNAPATFGNAGRNLVGGPSFVNFDLGLHKSFRIQEGKVLQFRAEAFNTFNTPRFHLLGAGTQVGTRNFGVINVADRPRNLQLGLRFAF